MSKFHKRLVVGRRRISTRQKTLRAYQAYIDLLDTADCIRREMRGQLLTYDLTWRGFRVLEMLLREGPQPIVAIAEEFQCRRQNVEFVVGGLEERGWVERVSTKLRPASGRAKPRAGRRIVLLRLTPRGDRFIAQLFPKHAKVVKSQMRVLDGREQAHLSRLLQKLREGDPVKFLREIRMFDVEEGDRTAEVVR